MRKSSCFPRQIENLQVVFRLLTLRFLGLAIIYALPVLALASPLTLVVANKAGGAIVADLPGKTCHSSCRFSFNANSPVSLFAIPEQGYRFQAWSGLCLGTTGPLCSLNPGKQGVVRARFIKSPAPIKPAKALLLLHREGNRTSVWNDFAEKYFDNQCATIYGGVILDKDIANTQNDVLCYRIAFGYYQSVLSDYKVSKVNQNWQAHRNFAIKLRANEIEAAVLGIQARHPDAQIAMISETSANDSAQVFLKTDFGQKSHILGLLSLQPKQKLLGNGSHVSSKQVGVMVGSFASAQEPVKINNALTQITGTWWLMK